MSDGLTEAWRQFGNGFILAKNCKFYKSSDTKVDEYNYTTEPYICVHSKNCPAGRSACDCR